MKALATLLLVLGFALQLIVPLIEFSAENQRFLFLPTNIFLEFVGTVLIGLAIFLYYISWYAAYAKKMDENL